MACCSSCGAACAASAASCAACGAVIAATAAVAAERRADGDAQPVNVSKTLALGVIAGSLALLAAIIVLASVFSK